jgi:hypothetical protein
MKPARTGGKLNLAFSLTLKKGVPPKRGALGELHDVTAQDIVLVSHRREDF